MKGWDSCSGHCPKKSSVSMFTGNHVQLLSLFSNSTVLKALCSRLASIVVERAFILEDLASALRIGTIDATLTGTTQQRKAVRLSRAQHSMSDDRMYWQVSPGHLKGKNVFISRRPQNTSSGERINHDIPKTSVEFPYQHQPH